MPYIQNSSLNHFLKTALLSASYKNGSIICAFTKNIFFLKPIITLIGNLISSNEKNTWRIIISGLRAMLWNTIEEKRLPYLPSKYFDVLNKALKHYTKSVRNQAIQSILSTACVLYLEYRISGQEYTKKMMRSFSKEIDPDLLKNSCDLENFINSVQDWGYIAQKSGLKWEYVNDPNNKNLIIEALKAFWPKFTL